LPETKKVMDLRAGFEGQFGPTDEALGEVLRLEDGEGYGRRE